MSPFFISFSSFTFIAAEFQCFIYQSFASSLRLFPCPPFFRIRSTLHGLPVFCGQEWRNLLKGEAAKSLRTSSVVCASFMSCHSSPRPPCLFHTVIEKFNHFANYMTIGEKACFFSSLFYILHLTTFKA